MKPPPSTATFANLKTNNSPNKVDGDDDLPPRVQTSSPPTITNSEASVLSRPSTPPNDSSHLPIHAGFDLTAMTNILQEVERDSSKSQAPAPSPPAKTFPSTPAKAVPSRSTPPVDDTAPRITGGSSPRENLTSSLSSNDLEDDPSYKSRTSRLQSDNSITVSDDNIPTWGASSTSTASFSSTNLSLYDRNIPPPPVMTNPFASSSSLAFGTLDGTVSGAGMDFQADPWSIPLSGKRKTTLDSYSPWS